MIQSACAITAWWCASDDRLPGRRPVEQTEQLLDVGEVQASSRLVEDVDALAAIRVASWYCARHRTAW